MNKIYVFGILVVFGHILIAVRSDHSAPGKLIIDTDAGADDAAAILLILKAEEQFLKNQFETIAITCTYGNTRVDNVVQNVLKTLTIANRGDIPVYRGADKSLLYEYIPETYFGEDGFGDFNFTEHIIGSVITSHHAALEMVNLAKKYPGQVTLLALGPLTNVAIAITLDPSFISRLKNLVIMGASVAGVGNKSPNVEFNFAHDPESNFIVLNSTDVNPAILLPWETVKLTSATKEWRINTLGKLNSRISNFLNNAERISLIDMGERWNAADPMTAAILVLPKLIRKNITTNVYPVVDGIARGSILVDSTDLTQRPKNTIIVQEIDKSAYLSLLLESFK